MLIPFRKLDRFNRSVSSTRCHVHNKSLLGNLRNYMNFVSIQLIRLLVVNCLNVYNIYKWTYELWIIYYTIIVISTYIKYYRINQHETIHGEFIIYLEILLLQNVINIQKSENVLTNNGHLFFMKNT